ncbi:MAG: ABC transporter permease [Peptococcaceae bacterium]|nr:ABC transporter permease [Peptococcaceae bacterium]
MKKYFDNMSFKIGFIILSALCGLLLLSFAFLPVDPYEMDLVNKFRMPAPGHLLGTDNFGRDIFSRILKGSQPVFFVGFVAVSIGFCVGSALGAVAGYFGGAADEVIMRVIDAQMAFPGVITALVVITVFGPGALHTAIALGVMSIPRFCRMTRSGFMQAKEMDYVKAARSRGASHLRIITLHIFPNISTQIVVTASLAFSGSVLAEAGLSYLGLGIAPPEPSWGKMLYEAQSFLLTQPWYAMIPGSVITLLALGFNLLGDGVRDVEGMKAG